MDENFVEMAEKLAEAEIQAGIARARARVAPPPGFDGDCECGNEINPKRVALGYYLCIDCQFRKERRAGHF